MGDLPIFSSGDSDDVQQRIAQLDRELVEAKQRLALFESINWRLDPAHAFAYETNDARSSDSILYNHPAHHSPPDSEVASSPTEEQLAIAHDAELLVERHRTINLAWGIALASTMLVVVSAIGISTGQMLGALVVLIVTQTLIGVALGTWAFVVDRSLSNQTERSKSALQSLSHRDTSNATRPTQKRTKSSAKLN